MNNYKLALKDGIIKYNIYNYIERKFQNMGKLEKYLDKEKIANTNGDICIINILSDTINKKQ